MKSAAFNGMAVVQRDPDRWRARANYLENQLAWAGNAMEVALFYLSVGRAADAKLILERRLEVVKTGLAKIEAEDRS